jgi:hypothetical protein
MLYFVYKLVDPRTNQPFYIGITKNPNYSMWQHLTANDGNKRKRDKIVDIQSEGLSPRMRIIEITENERTVLKKETYTAKRQQPFNCFTLVCHNQGSFPRRAT